MFLEYENPSKAIAVRKTLAVVTILVPNLLVSLYENKLERIVPPEITMDIIPINEIEAPISRYIIGQADPKSESGNPKLINARYIIAISRVYMIFVLFPD